MIEVEIKTESINGLGYRRHKDINDLKSICKYVRCVLETLVMIMFLLMFVQIYSCVICVNVFYVISIIIAMMCCFIVLWLGRVTRSVLHRRMASEPILPVPHRSMWIDVGRCGSTCFPVIYAA